MDRSKSRPKEVKIKPGSTCLICGIEKPLDNAHIIPDSILRQQPEINKRRFRDHDGLNIFYLCCNHHRAYDHDLLSPEEFEIVKPRIQQAIDTLNSHIVEVLAARVELSKAFFIRYQSFITSVNDYGKK